MSGGKAQVVGIKNLGVFIFSIGHIKLFFFVYPKQAVKAGFVEVNKAGGQFYGVANAIHFSDVVEVFFGMLGFVHFQVVHDLCGVVTNLLKGDDQFNV